MRKCLSLVILIAVIINLPGCYYDKEDLVYPKSTCDTLNMTYTKDIQSIITVNCSGCHTGNVATGVNLGTYAGLRTRADNGRLLDRITTTDPNRLMPKGGPRLPECEISKIKAWINRGAPN